MNCNEAKSVWIDLMYGELGNTQSAAVREHLDACAACRLEYSALLRTREQLNFVAGQPVRIDLARLCLRGADQWERSRRRWRRIGYLTAATVALIAVFLSRQVCYEFRDGQMLIAWRNVVKHPQPVEVPPAIQSPSEHLVSADYLRLRSQIVDQGVDAVFNSASPDKEPSETPRSYRVLRDQLFKSIDPSSESSI